MFKDRHEVGILLAEKLKRYKGKRNVVVIGLARGGVVVSHQVAKELNLPHDILVVKKIGSPYNPELAIGAVGPNKTVYWDEELCSRLGISKEMRNSELRIRNKERKEKEKVLRGVKPIDIQEKEIILVDDGVATGATAIVAGMYLKKQKASLVVLAIPIISKDTLQDLEMYFDRIITLKVVKEFQAVGQFYEDFPQIEDEEVVSFLSS